MDPLDDLLTRFEAVGRRGPFDYRWCHHHDGGGPGPHLVVGSIVHGNEVGSLPSVVSLAENLVADKTRFTGRLTLFLGNPEAARAGRRFLDTDLNRAFVDQPPANHEGNRARELKPILDSADVFVDLHQTIEATDRAFYTFPFDEQGWHWARAIGGASTWVTRPATETFSAGTCCADEYVRLADKPGLTLELGHQGFSDETRQRADAALERLLATGASVGAGRQTLEELAREQPELDFVQSVWAQRFEVPRMRLRPGLTNFAPVSAGELLSADGTPEVLAPVDGLVLFPKYPEYDDDGTVIEPRPNELVRIAQPLTTHPIELWS